MATRAPPLWDLLRIGLDSIIPWHFEKTYEADQQGKRDWPANNAKSLVFMLGLLVWMITILIVSLESTFIGLEMLYNLTNVFNAKEMHLKEMASKFEETENFLHNLMEVKDKLHQAYNEELKKLQSTAWEHFKKKFSDHQKMKSQLEMQKSELEIRSKELEKCEAKKEIDRKNY